MGFFKIKSASTNTQSVRSSPDELVDLDGNVYKTVKIGSQLWMAENLKVTHYRNGDAIQEVMDNYEWTNLNTGARCVHYNKKENAAVYGCLYNWFAVDDNRSIAPEGWHVPTDDEWKELEMHLGMSRKEADETGFRGSPVGSRLAGNASLWDSDELKNHAEFGTSGFSALPAGGRLGGNGTFHGMDGSAAFWSAPKSSTDCVWGRYLSFKHSDVARHDASRPSDERDGFSVRLVKD